MSADEIREALAKMTPGDVFSDTGMVVTCEGCLIVCEADNEDDLAGIVTLRNKVPALLDELAAEKARAEKAEAALSNLLWAYDHADDFGPDHGAIMKLKARQAARAALEANNAGR